MKKIMYIIMAVFIAAGLTTTQYLISKTALEKNELTVYTAKIDIKKGGVLTESDIKNTIIYLKEAKSVVESINLNMILDKTASRDIVAGEIINIGDIYLDNKNYEEMRCLALEVSGKNFNAGDLEIGDYIDLYIVPEIDKLTEQQIMWINSILQEAGIKYIPGKTPGILFENILIEYIETSTGQIAKYVSIRVEKPLDEVIAFLEEISFCEFIKR